MKNKIITLLGMTFILAIGLFWFFHDKEQSMSVASLQTVESNVVAIKSNTPMQYDAQQVETNETAKPTTNQASLLTASHAALVKEMQAAYLAKNIPIDFYGRVIDQDSNSLFGVKIHVGVRHWEVTAEASSIPVERETDADGRFEIHSVSGDSFGVLLLKDGYEAESEKNGFGGGISGSYENPVVFKMWSTNIHEQLITGGKSFHIVPDGRAYIINLTDDTISETGEGDLKVWIRYTNQVVQGQLYDWSCSIDVINGGLLEDNSLAPYVAPKENYAPRFKLEQQIKGGQRGSLGDKQFFLLLKNGQEYGRMKIDLIAPFNMGIPGLIRLSYAINPSGSRVLR